MKNIREIIDEALKIDDPKQVVESAVNAMLGEGIAAGNTVAVIDDTINGMNGAKGKVRSISKTNPGFAEVEFPNGAIMHLQTSLLVPVD